MERSKKASSKRERMIYCGVDEAGRGPVIGPMVVAGVCINEEEIRILSNFIKKDSKGYTKNKRNSLYQIIIRILGRRQYIYHIVDAYEINKWMEAGRKLNELELKHFTNILCELLSNMPDTDEYKKIIYVDSPDIKPERFELKLKDKIENCIGYSSRIEVVCEHKADERYLPVSIASIIAKVIRDKEIEKLNELIGVFGSGYPSDYRTRIFLKKLIDNNELQKYYRYIRLYWKTLRKLEGVKD